MLTRPWWCPLTGANTLRSDSKPSNNSPSVRHFERDSFLPRSVFPCIFLSPVSTHRAVSAAVLLTSWDSGIAEGAAEPQSCSQWYFHTPHVLMDAQCIFTEHEIPDVCRLDRSLIAHIFLSHGIFTFLSCRYRRLQWLEVGKLPLEVRLRRENPGNLVSCSFWTIICCEKKTTVSLCPRNKLRILLLSLLSL